MWSTKREKRGVRHYTCCLHIRTFVTNIQVLTTYIQLLSVTRKFSSHTYRFFKTCKEHISNFSDTTGLSVSGLGGLSLQDVPDLVLQILFCVGSEGTVTPQHLTLPTISVDPTVVVVLRCGYRALNYFYNLRRSNVTPTQIAHLTQEVKRLHFDCLLLYRMRQMLLKLKKNYQGNSCVSTKKPYV